MDQQSDDPKKSLGQHWLKDEKSLDNIVNSIDINTNDTILEIGPGLGSLTDKLLSRAGEVVAVELDPGLIEELSKRFAGQNLRIEEGDILKFNLTSLPKNYKLVANIPYYLTSNLLRVLNESQNPFSEAVLLMQKEVAERVAAAPGDMSLLSVSVQFYCKVKLGAIISADKFTPQPKVDSRILILKTRPSPLFADVDTMFFFRIVKAGFSQKRKTLLNSLSGGLKIDRDLADELIRSAKIVPKLRPQQLQLEDWYSLYKVFNSTSLLHNNT